MAQDSVEGLSDGPPDQADPPNAEPHDPWAHRRGEPRLFAFAWTMYVLIAVAGSVTWVARFGDLSSDSYGPGARIMLVVVAVGITVLWPMVRLSQASPDRSPLAATALDVFVVLIPVQMVIWPLLVLARWPVNIVGALALLAFCWTLLTGALLAMALAGRHIDQPGQPGLAARAWWMLAFVAIVLAAPIAILFGAQGDTPPMLSPLSAIPAITGKGLAGPQNPVTDLQWRLIGLVGVLSVVAWILAAVRGLFVRTDHLA